MMMNLISSPLSRRKGVETTSGFAVLYGGVL
jgi:hypothetical protein